MRKLLITLVSALSVSIAALPAHADRGYGGGGHGGGSHGDYRGGERHDYRGNRHHGSGHDSAWAGLAIFGALAGLAIMADNSRPVYAEPQYVQPAYPAQPVYMEAPVYAPPAPAPSSTWYYCQSSRTYYPYTRACPEGWMAVPARPY